MWNWKKPIKNLIYSQPHQTIFYLKYYSELNYVKYFLWNTKEQTSERCQYTFDDLRFYFSQVFISVFNYIIRTYYHCY